MQKTIQIGDKYKPLMKWYNEQYDKEEFNVFISKLLVSFKSMKDKNIDLIIFSKLVEKYDVDIYDLIKLLEENAKSQPLNNDSLVDINNKEVATEENNQTINISNPIKAKENNKNIKSFIENNNKENKEEKQKEIKIPSNAILSLGINLSG
ncbi:hypothetical protein [Alkaliphilus sp. B6464]|uniref:hypothetical protein n=1 Tax=Alkaliphilus sp. B6464 TaxID=2731219 RepID=UPI001BA71660|nr:hypothetical protein [Alkaliphilus sp. B6464]QUH22122.1 hypothetical protein HYG84_19640 [Alkaliphilus sp. B6464]